MREGGTILWCLLHASSKSHYSPRAVETVGNCPNRGNVAPGPDLAMPQVTSIGKNSFKRETEPGQTASWEQMISEQQNQGMKTLEKIREK